MPPLTRYGPYKGQFFTIKELQEKTGLSIPTLRSRMHRGWDIAQIIETPLGKSGVTIPKAIERKKYPYRDGKYTIDQLVALDSCAVTAFTIRTRIKAGWDIKAAVETPLLREYTPPKQLLPSEFIEVVFTKPVTGVNEDMQPNLNVPYQAEVGWANNPTRGTNYFIIKLENGKKLIVYESEFVRQYTA